MAEQSNILHTNSAAGQPPLEWDGGTAYDFFISLVVLNSPEMYGLRGSWAAGVRSRLSPDDRRVLETSAVILNAPLFWVYRLPAPKDAAAVLAALKQLPPEQRLPALAINPETRGERESILEEVARQGKWTETEADALRSCLRAAGKDAPRLKELTRLLDTWAAAGEFGEEYLSALNAYYQNFFAEEEARIAPLNEAGLAQAQALGQTLPVTDLVERLSQGVVVEELATAEKVTFAPSYWLTPYLYLIRVTSRHFIVAFGSRSGDDSLVPGEMVPDALLLRLKALADPTRLRILRYLAHSSLTQAELGRRLRLRAPTITHHISALRLAGLVHVDLAAKSDRRYALRKEAVETLHKNLVQFLESESES
jgi:DNA-binding transcriptional ArsR family regulator